LEIIELLGMGGMGMVYKARQPQLDRLVALKILPVESQQHPSFAERFSREAKALAKLNHPGIVDVYDFGQTGHYYYFVMEFVDGMNLRQLLQSKTVEPRQALELVTQICTALQFAHDEGVVHRDIKPENILLNKKGQVKIADFGLAKLLGTAPDTALTMSQAAMGTMNYMAPEQRQNAQGVDHRADIYSLGVVFYEMLTGEVPMGRFEPPSKRVQVDVRLDEVVLKALEREPARRYQQVSEVKSNVETIAQTGPPPPAAAAEPSGQEPETNVKGATINEPARVAGKRLSGNTSGISGFRFVINLLLLTASFALVTVPTVYLAWIGVQINSPPFDFNTTDGQHVSMGGVYGITFGSAALDFTSGKVIAVSTLLGACFLLVTQYLSRFRFANGLLIITVGTVVTLAASSFLIHPPPNRHEYSVAEMEAMADASGADPLYRFFLDESKRSLFAVLGKYQISEDEWKRVEAQNRKVVFSRSERPGPLLCLLSGLALIVSGSLTLRAMVSECSSAAGERTSAAAASPDFSQPRLSRTALIGAVWAPWFFLAALAFATVEMRRVPLGSTPTGPAGWQGALLIALLLPGVTAPFGTTILGYVALSQILHSAGRLYGLGLALFDALVFPLLVVDYLIMAAGSVLATALVSSATAQDMATVVDLLIVVVLDFFIVRKIWRFYRRKNEN
jgi:serine/threonine protein kinase